MGILDEINSLVKSAAAMPPQNPVVPGIGAPSLAGRIAPTAAKTPAQPIPLPQTEAGGDKKFDWLKAWMARNRAKNQNLISKEINPNNSQLGYLRRIPVDRLNRINGAYR